jgi:hypothetical protein
VRSPSIAGCGSRKASDVMSTSATKSESLFVRPRPPGDRLIDPRPARAPDEHRRRRRDRLDRQVHPELPRPPGARATGSRRLRPGIGTLGVAIGTAATSLFVYGEAIPTRATHHYNNATDRFEPGARAGPERPPRTPVRAVRAYLRLTRQRARERRGVELRERLSNHEVRAAVARTDQVTVSARLGAGNDRAAFAHAWRWRSLTGSATRPSALFSRTDAWA